MAAKTSHLSMRKNEPRICFFIKDGFLLNDGGRKRKGTGVRDDLSAGFAVLSRVEFQARPSQRKPHITYELMIPVESIERVVTLKKRRGKNAKVFASTAELKRRLDAFERACDFRFEVLLQAINQLMKPEVPRRRRRARKL